VSLAAARKLLILYMVFTAALTALLFSIVLMRLIVRPLDELARATARITEGDLDHRVPIRARNEIGKLAETLETLQKTLQERNTKVAQQSGHLKSAAERLRRAEDEVVRQDRLAYLGRVAAGVAHEVGNPLGAVFNYLAVLQSLTEADAEAREIVGRTQSELERIDRIMRGLLSFSRMQEPQTESVELRVFLEECVRQLRDQRQLEGIDVKIVADDGLPAVEIDAGQIKQVIFNAATNARDAMGAAGGMEIRLSAAPFDELAVMESLLGAADDGKTPFTDLAGRGIAFSSKPPFEKGEMIAAVHIRDDGPGLGREAVQRVFEPFFTTKPPGKGTGLGLAICQRIVEGQGGVLRFESRRDAGNGIHGAVFSIYLPYVRREKAQSTEALLASVIGDA
jgi:signal transduction histidine kinase